MIYVSRREEKEESYLLLHVVSDGEKAAFVLTELLAMRIR